MWVFNNYDINGRLLCRANKMNGSKEEILNYYRGFYWDLSYFKADGSIVEKFVKCGKVEFLYEV